MSEHILLAYNFDNKGGGESLKGDAISKQIKDDAIGFIWMRTTLTQGRGLKKKYRILIHLLLKH